VFKERMEKAVLRRFIVFFSFLLFLVLSLEKGCSVVCVCIVWQCKELVVGGDPICVLKVSWPIIPLIPIMKNLLGVK
jgi:hypothetical protein